MGTISCDVGPYLSPDNEVLSLQSLGPLQAFRVSATSPNRLPNGVSTDYASKSMTTASAINAGFESLVSLNASINTQYFMIDFVAWANPVDGIAESAIERAYYGSGFRIGIKAWSVNNKIEASVAGIAAQSTLGLVSSSYEIKFFGIDLKHLGIITPFIGNNVGNFDATAMQQLGSIMAKTSSVILSAGASLKPVLLKVDINPSHKLLAYSSCASICYALRSISNRKKLTIAINEKPAPPNGFTIEDSEVQNIYNFFGIQGEETPSGFHARQSKKYLFD